MPNKNTELINNLRLAARYLEDHPDIPAFQIAWLHRLLYTKEELKAAARAMGSFEKTVDDHNYSLVRNFGLLKLEVAIPRQIVCEKVVTWKCPEEGLLESIESTEEDQ